MISCGIQGYLNDALHAPVLRTRSRVRNAKPAGNRRTHSFTVEVLTLDFRVLDRRFGRGLQFGFQLQSKSKALQTAQ